MRIAVGVVVGVLVLAGCSVSTPQPPPRPSSSAVLSSSSVAIPTPVAVPSPDNTQQAALLTALNEVLPGVADNTDRAVRNARQVCGAIIDPDSIGRYSVNEYTQLEFEGGQFPDVTEAQADGIIQAVQSTFCS